MAAVIWSGVIEGQNYRVVDLGASFPARLVVEVETAADAMGGRGWQRFEPIPTLVFEGILESAGIIQ